MSNEPAGNVDGQAVGYRGNPPPDPAHPDGDEEYAAPAQSGALGLPVFDLEGYASNTAFRLQAYIVIPGVPEVPSSGPFDAAQILETAPDNTSDGGTGTITFDGETTTVLAFDADAVALTAALEALSSIGPGNVVVDASSFFNAGTLITFTGDLGGQDIGEGRLSGDASALTGPDSPYDFNVAQSALGSPFVPAVPAVPAVLGLQWVID